MVYIPIQGLTKKGYIPIQGLPIQESKNTIPIAPIIPQKTGGFWGGVGESLIKGGAKFQEMIGGTGATLPERIAGVGKKALSTALSTGRGILSETAPVKTIANIQAGMPVIEAIKKGYSNLPRDVKIAEERAEMRRKALAAGKTPEEAELIATGLPTPTQRQEMATGVAMIVGGMENISNKLLNSLVKAKTAQEVKKIVVGVSDDIAEKIAQTTNKYEIEYLFKTAGIPLQAAKATTAAVNIERLNIPEEAKQKVIKASEEIKPQLEAVKGKVLSNSEVVEAAQASEILRRGTTREATLKSEAILLKTRQHLAELAKNEKLTPDFIDTLKIVSAEAAKRGRELQALGIEADPVLGTVKAKLVKQLLDMGIETEKIIKASEGIDFNNAQQVMKFFRTFIKPTLPEIVDEYRYINMLSSPKTQIINTFSNILQTTVLRPATRLASGITDSVASTLTGKEQEFYVSQVPAYYRGVFNSFGDALSEAMKVMRGEQQIYRPDIKNIPTGWKIFKPFQVIPRLMEASDVFFRRLATGGELEALMSKGMTDTEAVTAAAKTAEELVFRKALDPLNKTGQGILLSKIDALTTAVYKLRNVPGVKWFIPFVQTPMNILKQGIEYSPLGITTLAGNINKIEQFGKTLVGTTVFGGAGWLALKDRTSWAVPTNQKEKDAFYAAGMQPYSVKIGDTWVSYSRLGPLAYPMAMAAAIKFYTKDNPKAVGDSELKKITKIFSGIAQFFSDQSYVQGIGDFVNLAQGDITALTRAASQIPSQLIPLTALQRWVANLIDPIYRKTEKELSVEGIIENLKSGLPGLTFGIPPYTTPTGEPSKRQYQFINPISPISISKENPKWVDYFNTLQQVSRERVLETKSKEELKQSAQDLYDKMKSLPKEEAKRQFDDLIKNNPDLAKEVSDLATEVKLDYKESFLKSLGVENGQRAKYVVEELDKLSQEEKKAYYQNLIDKKVITPQVNEQILELLNRK